MSNPQNEAPAQSAIIDPVIALKALRKARTEAAGGEADVTQWVNGVPYWHNMEGNLIPLARINELDQGESAMVKDLVGLAQTLAALVQEFRTFAFGEVGAYMQLSEEKNGIAPGGKKGNATYYAYDGSAKVEVAQQDKIAFDHKLGLAQQKFMACVNEWAAGAAEDAKPGMLNLITIVNETFKVDEFGAISPTKIAALRKYEFNDSRWVDGLNLVSESMRVIGKKTYIRFYVRNDDGKYDLVVTNFSSL